MENLGPDYSLGRMAINEIEDFRLDKKKIKRDWKDLKIIIILMVILYI